MGHLRAASPQLITPRLDAVSAQRPAWVRRHRGVVDLVADRGAYRCSDADRGLSLRRSLRLLLTSEPSSYSFPFG